MARYKTKTIQNGIGGTYKQTTTDHSDEIRALRAECERLMREHPPETATIIDAILVDAFATSAALLETHDATGLSLDNYLGPRQLVESCLTGIGYPSGTLLENGV